MYLNQFSVVVDGGNEISGGYVEMAHGKQYNLRLRNDRSVRCDAHVEIDGKHVGTWRLDAHRNVILERPAHDTGRFTFYKIGSQDADRAGIFSSNPNLGLIKVTFTPELIRPVPISHSFSSASSSPVTYENAIFKTGRGLSSNYAAMSETHGAGGTGLSGQSSQNFYEVAIMELDYLQQTVINLRLVENKLSQYEPRPLTQYSTPIPPRI